MFKIICVALSLSDFPGGAILFRLQSLLSLLVDWLVALHSSNMLVYLRDGSAQTIFACCHIG